jgi:hypothetical protein
MIVSVRLYIENVIIAESTKILVDRSLDGVFWDNKINVTDGN